MVFSGGGFILDERLGNFADREVPGLLLVRRDADEGKKARQRNPHNQHRRQHHQEAEFEKFPHSHRALSFSNR